MYQKFAVIYLMFVSVLFFSLKKSFKCINKISNLRKTTSTLTKNMGKETFWKVNAINYRKLHK